MPTAQAGRPDLRELRSRVLREASVVLVCVVLLGVVSARYDLPRALADRAQGRWGLLDDVVLLLAGSHLLMMVFGSRRAKDLKSEFARRKLAEQSLEHRATHDALTGLHNRSSFVEITGAAVRRDGRTAVVLLDMDRFKEVNDALGHQVGDLLLVSVAERLAGELQRTGELARLGGDEFAVLLPGCDAEQAQQVALRLLHATRRPFDVVGLDLALEVDASFGVAVAPMDGASATDLLGHADVAMYAAKAERCGVVRWSAALDQDHLERLMLYGELRRALAGGELRLHYQPKVDTQDGRVVGVEALVRWQHPVRGLLAPDAFLPLAEQTGLVRQLTDVVLLQALTDCRTWREQGLALSVAVNLSARSLVDAALPARVADVLRAVGLPADALELEVTESAAMQDPGRALEVLVGLRALGLRLSVDDYGTGHASLSYLTRLPVDTIKIDRSFVTTMEVDRSNATIVRSTIAMAHELGLVVVAEGVETGETWRQLARLGCDQAQGFWLARPGPADAVPATVCALERRLSTKAGRELLGTARLA